MRRALALALLCAVWLPLSPASGPRDARAAPEVQGAPPTPAAEALTRYLPAALRVSPAAEVTNEEFARLNPFLAALPQRYGRITGVQVPLDLGGRRNGSLQLTIFRSADEAWGFANEAARLGAGAARTPLVDLPEPGLGERSRAYRYDVAGAEEAQPRYLVFQRDRLAVRVYHHGADPARAQALEVAREVDRRIVEDPPPPPTPEELALSEVTPALLVRGAVRATLIRYIEELDPARLYDEAWSGASEAARRAGLPNPPDPPDFAAAEPEAAARFVGGFAELEAVGGKLPAAQLAVAAIREVAERRADCHTYYQTAEQYAVTRATQTGDAAPRLGVRFADDPPLRVVAVLPGSPAEAAGLRRGQVVLAIDGREVEGLSVAQATGLYRVQEGVAIRFRVRNPSGSVREISVAPARYTLPALEAELIDGNVGLVRFYTFQYNDQQVKRLRETLTDWEAAGVAGWIVDLRRNSGGAIRTLSEIAGLFTRHERLIGEIARGGRPQWVGTAGTPLPFQRPLVFLIGQATLSAAEMLPGGLRAVGRASIVGETSGGCLGTTRANGLLDGSAIFVTETEVVLGPRAERAHRAGVHPDLEVAWTPLDEELDLPDSQLAAAVGLVRQAAPPPRPDLAARRFGFGDPEALLLIR